jgi:hypothetical protein
VSLFTCDGASVAAAAAAAAVDEDGGAMAIVVVVLGSSVAGVNVAFSFGAEADWLRFEHN